MSTAGYLNERTVGAVLWALWKKPENSLAGLLRATLAPQPEVTTALEVLQTRGCLIERTPTEIRLVSTGLACWSDILEKTARDTGRRIGRRVMVFHRTASTNDIAWQCAANPECDGLLVVADEQTAGRGRLGHTWVAKAEQSVLMSVLFRDVANALDADGVDRLTLLAGLAVARGMEEALKAAGVTPRVEIKWPNDLLIEGKKIAGILVERRQGATVIGIGINVTQAGPDFPPDIAGKATSLYLAAGRILDRLRVVEAVLPSLERYCLGSEPPPAWLEQWKERCSMLGTRIRVKQGDHFGGALTGEVLDVDPLQGLVLRDVAGATHFLSARTTTLQV
jgi:BirA family biotin operon repressor/biotin-[acetyl-CoA-carboxylase] ligase